MHLLARRSKSWRSRRRQNWLRPRCRAAQTACASRGSVVVQQQGIRDFLATPPVVQQNQGVRTSRHPRRRRPIAGQRDQLIAILYTEKAATNHAQSESTNPQSATNFSRAFNESGYISGFRKKE